jgi:flagellin
MALRINANVASLNAQRSLSVVTDRLGKSFERLSSGLRVNRAGDDAAGLAISERMRADIRSLNQARRNASDGVSLIQTTEGALNEADSLLIRMRELAIQSGSGTLSDSDQDALDLEFQQLVSEIDRIAQGAEFNDKALLDGTTTSITLQVGSGTTAGVDTLTLSLESMRITDLSVDSLDIGSGGDVNAAISAIDSALGTVLDFRAGLGAIQNRLESTMVTLDINVENLTASESRIRDVDVASESAELTRNSIIQQAAVAILGQANVQPQLALSLLG